MLHSPSFVGVLARRRRGVVQVCRILRAFLCLARTQTLGQMPIEPQLLLGKSRGVVVQATPGFGADGDRTFLNDSRPEKFDDGENEREAEEEYQISHSSSFLFFNFSNFF